MQIVKREYAIYKFNELSEKAKEKAREWWRSGSALETDWEEQTIDDMKEAGRILGIEIDKIYYSGFWSQGDGACFQGHYQYCTNWLQQLTEQYGECKFRDSLQAIGQNLHNLQAEYGYCISASVRHGGYYYHKGCTVFDVTTDIVQHCEHFGLSDDQATYDASETKLNNAFPDIESGIKEFLRDFMDLIYKQLEQAYEYNQSDSCVDENIISNDYDFFESGKHFSL